MLSEKMQNALNAQINAELWSAYLYLSMSMDASAKGLKGVANWFAIQFKEEQDHAQILINYVNARGGRVLLAVIDAVQTEWNSPLAMYENTLEHEQKVTSLINDLYNLAIEEKDHATNNFLQWFVEEQVEEEENAMELVAKIKFADGDNRLMYELNNELGERSPSED